MDKHPDQSQQCWRIQPGLHSRGGFDTRVQSQVLERTFVHLILKHPCLGALGVGGSHSFWSKEGIVRFLSV